MPPSDESFGPSPPTEESDRSPAWDQEYADWLIGKYVLIGVTYVEADGETVKSQVQRHGRIVSADRTSVIQIECEGHGVGTTFTLPPDLSAFQMADPGEYKLRSTGETVTNPDVLATWTAIAPRIS